MYLSVDRIEEGYAVCEDDRGNCVNIELKFLPIGVKESDVLNFCSGKYYIDKDETLRRKEKAVRLQNEIIKSQFYSNNN